MFVFSNLATSIDGKIATANRAHFPLGTPKDRKQMQVLRKKCDAILFGASTLRAYRKSCGVIGANRQPANVVISSGLEGISPTWPFFQTPGMRRILFVSKKIPVSRLRVFEKSCEVLCLNPSKPTAPQIIRELSKRGVKRLLVEGGGSVMWDFVSQNAIDEYNVTITPKLVGGTEAPTLVDGKGFEPGEVLSLKLKSCRKIGDELYLVYRK